MTGKLSFTVIRSFVACADKSSHTCMNVGLYGRTF